MVVAVGALGAVDSPPVGPTTTTLVAVDKVPSEAVIVEVMFLSFVDEVDLVAVPFVPLGNEWVGINVGNEVTIDDGAEVITVEFGAVEFNCAAASAGRRRTEMKVSEYCILSSFFFFFVSLR